MCFTSIYKLQPHLGRAALRGGAGDMQDPSAQTTPKRFYIMLGRIGPRALPPAMTCNLQDDLDDLAEAIERHLQEEGDMV